MKLEKVKVLTNAGTIEPLSVYQLRRGYTSTQISKYFDLKEYIFSKNMVLYGQLIICEPLLDLSDKYRELKGESVSLTSLNRSNDVQQEMKANTTNTVASFSTHTIFMAEDISTSGTDQTTQANLMVKASQLTGIKCRIGLNAYIKEGTQIIHVDVAPFYYSGANPILKNPVTISEGIIIPSFKQVPDAFKKVGILW